MVTLRQLAAVPELDIAVLSGHDDLDRPVRRAHVTELPDPTAYVRADELVLTNGVWLDVGQTGAEYVAGVAKSAACGLLFGLLEERPRVPPEIIAACREHGLPLLALSIEVPFAQVSEALAELQAQERQHELVRSIARGDELLQAVARDAPERDVLAVLTRDHRLPVALVDAAGRLVAAIDLPDDLLDLPAIAAVIQGPAQAEITLRDGSVAAVFAVEGLGEPEALLVCARRLVDLTSAERAALTQTARFLTLEVTRRQAMAAVESRFAGELLEMLLDERRAGEVPGRLRSFAVDPDGPLVAVSTAFGEDGTAPQLASVVTRFWRRAAAPVVVSHGADDALAVIGWAGTADALREAAGVLAAEIDAQWPGRRATVGIGRIVAGHGELRSSLLEAREARRSAQRRRRGEAVVTFDNVGSHRVLVALHDPHTLEEFAQAVLGPLREHDARHRGELEHTLRTFLEAGGAWKTTAAALYVHVNTLRNRVRKIEELTGRDLQSTEDRVDFHLALHARGD